MSYKKKTSKAELASMKAAQEYDSGEEEEVNGGGGSAPPAKRRKKRAYKKAPDAPRRGRSAYVLFSMEAREDVKGSLPEGAKWDKILLYIAVTQIYKKQSMLLIIHPTTASSFNITIYINININIEVRLPLFFVFVIQGLLPLYWTYEL